MFRRKSLSAELFVFLDSVRSVTSEREEQQLSPSEEYLQALLQMKMTSAVSEQSSKATLAITLQDLLLRNITRRISTFLKYIVAGPKSCKLAFFSRAGSERAAIEVS